LRHDVDRAFRRRNRTPVLELYSVEYE